MPTLENKLYSFGAVSDIHLQYDTAHADFQRALTYFNETADVAFTCVCGDLTDNGQAADFQEYAQCVSDYSSNTPVYECTGNHDCYNTVLSLDSMQQYTGHNLYYTFTKENDVFIMFGMQYWDTAGGKQIPFSQEALQWLYETLETNRNKRCIVFQHCLRFDGSGKPYSPNMTGDLLNNTQGTVFKSLMQHYKNVIWFHGHSHMKFACQEDCSYANYDRMFGCHSVHIPSLAVPREYAENEYSQLYAESEGYVVDVYENHIVLKGRDFAKGKFLPIATYCIDTTLQEIPPNTYTDSTGTIRT
jgi:predicted phosphodiesterase